MKPTIEVVYMGCLTLKQVTPIIQALFEPYDLDTQYLSRGHAFISGNPENAPSWTDINNRLVAMVRQHYSNEIQLLEPVEIKMLLTTLGNFFAQGCKDSDKKNQFFTKLIGECIDFKHTPSLDVLFLIAQHFDDGHGLKKFEAEKLDSASTRKHLAGIDHLSIYMSSQIALTRESDALEMGQLLHELLMNHAISEIAQVLLIEVEGILCSIIDDDKRNEVRLALMGMLAISIQQEKGSQAVPKTEIVH